MNPRLWFLISVLCCLPLRGLRADDIAATFEVSASTMTWRIESDWSFQAEEAKAQVLERLQNSVWQLLNGLYSDLPAECREHLTVLLLHPQTIRDEQTLSAPREYGTRYQTRLTLTIPRDVVEHWATEEMRKVRSQWLWKWGMRGSIFFGLLMGLGLSLWEDYRLGGWHRSMFFEIAGFFVVASLVAWGLTWAM